DLAEDSGLSMLHDVGLVAPIPRTEDVGGDAYVTLLRPADSRRLIPEDSFLAQIKSWSLDRVVWSGALELSWIFNLELPFFIARVDRHASRIALHALHRVSQVVIEGGELESLSVHFNAVDESAGNSRHRS